MYTLMDSKLPTFVQLRHAQSGERAALLPDNIKNVPEGNIFTLLLDDEIMLHNCILCAQAQ